MSTSEEKKKEDFFYLPFYQTNIFLFYIFILFLVFTLLLLLLLLLLYKSSPPFTTQTTNMANQNPLKPLLPCTLPNNNLTGRSLAPPTTHTISSIETRNLKTYMSPICHVLIRYLDHVPHIIETPSLPN